MQILPRHFRQNNFLKSPQSTLYGKSSYFRVELFKFRFITSRSFTRGSYYEKKLGGSKTRTRWKQESWARFPGGVVAASRQFSPGARPGHIAARLARSPPTYRNDRTMGANRNAAFDCDMWSDTLSPVAGPRTEAGRDRIHARVSDPPGLTCWFF